MTDWTAVGLRFAVYADLALLFGVPFQLLRQRAAPSPGAVRAWLAALCLIGLLASLLALLALTAGMAGVGLFAVDGDTLRMVVTETPPGLAFVVRLVALAAALIATLLPLPLRGRLIAVVAAAGIAIATIAWTGHGAMDEGTRGWVHLIADIAHLLAAAFWIGAIATLLATVAIPRPDAARLRAAETALAGFAAAGTAMVAILIVTGIVNGGMLLGLAGARTLGTTLYGVLLLAKLALFGGMLGIASANRWWLTPRLEAALTGGDVRGAARALRLSLAAELAVVTIILALVAWLGTLSPLP